MEALNLSLYPTLEPKSEVATITEQINPSQGPNYTNPLSSLENILNSILPQQTKEASITRFRRILGETAQNLCNEQLKCIVAEFQFLINAWLDEYEQEVFNGMTLKEVLNEG